MHATSELCPEKSETCPSIDDTSSWTMWMRMMTKIGRETGCKKSDTYISFLFFYNNSSQNVVAQITFMTSQFLRVRNPVMTLLGPLIQGLLHSCNQGVGQDCCISEFNLVISTSKLIHVVVGIPQVPVGCWPKTSVPCYVGLSLGQLTAWELAFLRVSKRVRDSQQDVS